MIVSHEIFELLLGFGDLTLEDVGLLFFGVVDFVDLVEFLFRLYSESLCDVVIVMCLLVVHLVGGELLLCGIQAHTDLLLGFLYVFLFDFGLLQFQLERLLLFKQLLVEQLLHGRVERVVCGQILEIVFAFGFGHDLK